MTEEEQRRQARLAWTIRIIPLDDKGINAPGYCDGFDLTDARRSREGLITSGDEPQDFGL